MDFETLHILLWLFFAVNVAAALVVVGWRAHTSRQEIYTRYVRLRWSQSLIDYALGLQNLQTLLAGMRHLDDRQMQHVLLLTADLIGRVTGSARQRLYGFVQEAGAYFIATDLAASPWPARRIRAARILATLPAVETVAQLTDLTQDADEQVRKAAIQSLGRLALPQCAPPLVELYEQRSTAPTGVVFHALLELGPAAYPAFIKGLASEHPELRMVAVAGLEMAPEKLRIALDISQRMADLVSDSSAEVRAAVAHALGSFADPARDSDVLTLLGDRDIRVRRAAARAARYHFNEQLAQSIVAVAADDADPASLDAAQTVVYWLRRSVTLARKDSDDEMLYRLLNPATMSSTLQRAQLEAALR